ncbi:MAG: hypothetical protein NZM31_08185 [Gemmatales bacterium]|nr:hypothetical protein [Gemmatales bacterium]MDW8386971.1 hypothetical protein [Gemmatales bacterium]
MRKVCRIAPRGKSFLDCKCLGRSKCSKAGQAAKGKATMDTGRRWIWVMVIGLILGPTWAGAEVIILRDGFILRGNLLIEGQILRDPGGREFWIKKLGGFYMVDDGARRIVFSTRQVAEAQPDPPQREPLEAFALKPPLFRTEFSPALRMVKVEQAEEWSPEAIRKITLVNDLPSGGTRTFEQCVVHLNPQFLRVSARRVRWDASYLTSEFDTPTLKQMVRHALGRQSQPPGKRDELLTLHRFLRQAGRLAEAEATLKQLFKEFPEEESALAPLTESLRRQKAQEMIEAVEKAASAGQYQRAERLLAELPLDFADKNDVNRATALRNRVQDLKTRVEACRKHLEAVVALVKDEALLKDWHDALAEIRAGLNQDTVARLEAFLTLASQEERRESAGQPRRHPPEELLALAVSGWAVGDAGAERNVESVRHLWKIRAFLLDYLRTEDEKARSRFLDQYLREEKIATDILTQLIQLLRPPQQPDTLPTDLAVLTTAGPRRVSYTLLLPPEYHPHRPYPLLLVLPNVREQPEEALSRWREQAAIHGYLLAAPHWTDPLQERYHGQDEEQQRVIEVLADLRRRFQVDSDRIYMVGFDQSGTLAYDVALSHPDRFAGVAVFCASPGKLGRTYRGNAQYLPFYVVEGEKSPNNTGENRDLFEFWVNRGFPSLYVEYSGRGLEFYPGEVPLIFDWFNRKRRASGLPELGGPDEQSGTLGRRFCTIRPYHNRFYWVSSRDLAVGDNRPPATISARLVPAENGVLVHHTGFRQLSVWLNTAMVDFEQPVQVRVNPGSPSGKVFRGKLAPDPRILLEDFYLRGDRRNLYTARVDFN